MKYSAIDLDNDGAAAERLREYMRAEHKQLNLLGLVWAHYVERLDTKKIAAVHQCEVRTIQLKLKTGRAEVAHIPSGRTVAATPGAHPNTSYISGNGAADQPALGSPTDSPRTPQTIIGDNAQVVQGPVTGPVNQINTQHIYNQTGSTRPATS